MRLSTRRVVFIIFAALIAFSIHPSDAAAEAKVEAHVLKVDNLVIGKTLKETKHMLENTTGRSRPRLN